ncbi:MULTISPECIES: ABC transporter ATP-binding protein [Actibacterium]|uniref:ABC-type branched-subunit amino acid transport system ATPase component n=1 Tax=Actibacterium naphthalenivorans TaxID=1614693 RepID=A0A840CJK0_9RHOB|nr:MULTISPECIES: ABC transporter ATP-binding protein [Actibacterium]ALG91505.1 ABC transporter ATP-binding protein [Actibacterium sp. EMB200-NS6]MBB4022946.1 ABC-type branched-subunit amino acid transport system ATPase component [Actibacterium naphthalenivorans]
MLETRNLDKRFGAIHVTRDVSLKLEKGERRVILGPNGAGKTTLFNQLVGELSSDSGSIHLDGEDVTGLSVAKRARRGLSRSYQKNTLFDGLTIAENLGLAASVAQGHATSLLRDSLSRSEVRETVAEVAAQVDLAPVLDALVSEVSYGIRRQLEVGVALATRPKVILMDEPTSGVGPEMAHGFHKMLNDLPRDLTLLIIEHDMDLAFDVADTITVLNYGEVVFDGLPEAARNSAMLKEIYLGSWEDA